MLYVLQDEFKNIICKFTYTAGWYPRFILVSTLCTTLLILHSWQNSKASRSAVPRPSTTITPALHMVSQISASKASHLVKNQNYTSYLQVKYTNNNVNWQSRDTKRNWYQDIQQQTTNENWKCQPKWAKAALLHGIFIADHCFECT